MTIGYSRPWATLAVVATAFTSTTAVAGCDAGEDAGTVMHPTRENLQSTIPTATAGSPVRQGGLDSIARALRTAKVVAEIGVLEGAADLVFGEIQDVAAWAGGTALVLDGRFNEVRAVSPSGNVFWRFGQSGTGPEEFESPQAIEVVDDSTFVVADRRRLLKVFALRGGRPAWRSQALLDFGPEGLCHVGDFLLVQGSHTSHAVVHRVGIDGAVRGRFGASYLSANPIVSNQLSDGPIGCSAASRNVAYGRKYLPLIHGYSAEGGELWVARLEPFRTMDLLEHPDGGFQPRPPATGTFNTVVGIVGGAGDGFIVQVGHHSLEGFKTGRRQDSLTTFLVDSGTGRSMIVGGDLPLIHAVDWPLLYGSVSDPFPRLLILSVEAATPIPAPPAPGGDAAASPSGNSTPRSHNPR